MKRFMMAAFMLLGSCLLTRAQQGFFLNNWQPRAFAIPTHTDTVVPVSPASVSITVHCTDTVAKVPVYVFGDNANTWTTCMSNNPVLMQHIRDRNQGVMRGPGGSISDVYFWNRNPDSPPTDVPNTLMSGGSNPGWEWYGKRPYSWDPGWTMDIDSFYSILKETGLTGLLTVNYGYARYGTSSNPVAQAAHMAADWVRYDKGRTKFWEIGNEVSGSWEAGYQIDTSLNKDGQPQIINGTLYGQHCRVFIDSMRAAAAETGAGIYIGAVCGESAGSDASGFNVSMMKEVGDEIDFYIIHSYYTPWQQNSTAATILSTPTLTSGYVNYLKICTQQAGVPMRPVALTEYNINAIGSRQMVSQIDGIFSMMVVGEAIKAGIGETSHWDLANGWNNGDDGGTYSFGGEPDVDPFAPRPVFYYLYYMRKCLGDVMLRTTFKGTADVTAYSSAFGSGQKGSIVVNKGARTQNVRINFSGATVGDRFYSYTLVGGTDVPADPTMPYSRKVLVNGEGPSGVAGGPSDYATLNARSGLIGSQLVIESPPFSVTYLVVDSGGTSLVQNDTISPVVVWNTPADIVYGTKLSSTQLNASTYLSGTYTYSPPAGTMLHAGTAIPLGLTFTPWDTSYSPMTKTVLINVKKATPPVSWSTPADLPSGTALGNDQLNATASVQGTFLYDPAAGTVLDTGTNQLLQVTFIPTDTADYNTVTKTVKINVYKAMGIKDMQQQPIRIYPVPVTDKLVISDLPPVTGNRQIRLKIFSAVGRTLFEENLQSGGNEAVVDVSTLRPGVYLLEIYSGEQISSSRFVKQ